MKERKRCVPYYTAIGAYRVWKSRAGSARLRWRNKCTIAHPLHVSEATNLRRYQWLMHQDAIRRRQGHGDVCAPV